MIFGAAIMRESATGAGRDSCRNLTLTSQRDLLAFPVARLPIAARINSLT